MGLKVRIRNKITHFFFIKVIKTYNDKKNLKNHLGFWISYTLTNKKSNYILNNHMTRLKK